MNLDQQSIEKMAPFAKTLGVHFVALDRNEVRAQLDNAENLSTLGGNMHGGAIMTLADLAGAVCAGLNVPDESVWSTSESSTYFLRPIPPSSTAYAVARPVKLGQNLITVAVDVYDNVDKHCIHNVQVISVRPGQ